MGDELRVTLGAEWRKRHRAGVVMELPSGLVARVQSIGPGLLLRSGKIPDLLTPLIAELMGEKSDKPLSPDTMKALIEQDDFTRAVCESMLVEPRVVEHPTTEDEIAFDDLEYEDQQLLIAMVGWSTRRMEQFRDEQARHVDSLVSAKRRRAARESTPEPATVGPAGDGF